MPAASIPATITTINGRWYARFSLKGRNHALPVKKSDAWTFDVERGLQVRIRLVKGSVVIAGRRGKNRYVRAGEDSCRL
jgi:hypothetical protein